MFSIHTRRLKKLSGGSLAKSLPSMGGLRLVYPLEAQVPRIRPGISPGIFTIIGMGGTGGLSQNPAKPRFFSPDLPANSWLLVYSVHN
jgi:hypothetical protein